MRTERLGLWGKGKAMRTPIFDKQALESSYLDICEQIKDSGSLGVWGCGESLEKIKDELDFFIDKFISKALALACKQYADGFDEFMANSPATPEQTKKRGKKVAQPTLPF